MQSNELDLDITIDIDQLVRDGLLNRDEAQALVAAQAADQLRQEALPTSSGDSVDKDEVKESATKHKRHWVRVTRLCNQRCTFCLDSMNQDGTYVDVDSLKAYILLGRKLGRERLILSGGEASVHPAYIELIRYGKQVGYEWVQTITNGMMFSYKRFAQAAADAGLDEATVSMHGHTSQLQDKLTGTPGAFVTGVKGMQNLQATGKVVVNIDVVINKQNYRFLPDIIEYYYNMGIREFDLLHIIPFGRGFDEHRHSLFFDLNDAVPYFRKAFEWSKREGVYLWTNRLPVTYLEGFERLIQDPHKLMSEFDGGRHNFESYLKRGIKPDCHGERCDFCFLDGPCRQTMFPYREHLEQGTFAEVAIDSQHVWQGPQAKAVFDRQAASEVVVTARTAQEALACAATLGHDTASRTVALDPGADFEPLLRQCLEPGATQPIQRLQIRTLGDAQRLLQRPEAVPATLVVELALDAQIASWLITQSQIIQALGDRLVAALPNHEYLSESRDIDPTPAQLRQLAEAGVRLKNVPPCVAGAPTEAGRLLWLDAKMLDGSGALDLDRYVHHYVKHAYYAKSIRCGLCSAADQCQGIHINYLRNHGFAIMHPLDDQGQALTDGASFEQLADRLKAANAARSKREQQKVVGLHKPVVRAVADLAIGDRP